jgi:hypothetical protein
MNQPLGRAAGHTTEVIESIECLKGHGPADLMEVTYSLTGHMLVLGGKAKDTAAARQQMETAIANGSALKVFREMCAAQGGDAKVVDVTKADNVFGQFTWASPAHAFPWDQGYTVFVAMKRGEYIAAEFTVPYATPPAQRGTIYKGESVPGPANLVAISRNCGSFVPDTGTQFCTARTGSPGQAVMGYRLPSAAGAACVLTPGVRYYLNIKLADPLAVDPNCTATTCRFTLQNNHSP